MASASDAIVVAEDWISEHYFTTDAKNESFRARVLARRKEWDEQKDERHRRARGFTAARGRAAGRFATLDDADATTTVRALHRRLCRDPRATTRSACAHEQRRTGDVRSAPPGSTDPPTSPSSTPRRRRHRGAARQGRRQPRRALRRRRQDHGHLGRPAALHALRRRRAPAGVRAGARRPARCWSPSGSAGPRVATSPSTCSSSASATTTSKGGEVDRALTCLAAESLAPDAEGDIWWTTTLDESVKHTVGVSKDLREGVRLSIEIIANEVVTADARPGSRRRCPQEEAQPLAKQSLRFLYRILFLLYAEASPELGVLPTGAPEYERGYSLDRLRELTLVELATPQARRRHPPLRVARRALPARRPGPRRRPPSDDTDERVDGLTFRSLRADLFKPAGDRAHRRGRPGQRRAPGGAAPPAAQQGERAAATAASSPTPSSASTSSARSTRV